MVHPLQKLFESRSLLVVRVLALSLFVLLCTSVSQGTHMETHPIIDVRMNLTCSNTTDPCNDLLNRSCGDGASCTFRDVFSDSTNISYDIRNTDQYQPSFILTVEGGDYVDLGNQASKKGYVVGYRGCSSNPSQVCYIRHASGLPKWTHNVTVRPEDRLPLPVSEQCTFFACFQYCNLENCTRVRKELLEKNITILATCPDLGNTTENGNVSYTRDHTEQGKYAEDTRVTVSCDEGYKGGGDITCQNDGNWSSPILPSCTIVDCSTPPLLLNGDNIILHEPFNTTYGSIVTYRCNSLLDYVFSETSSDNHTCLLSGDWSDETITCLATCANPDLDNTIENGKVSYTRDPTEQGHYVENTTVTVSCDEGYRSSGDIICQNDGNWSSASMPNCTMVTCPDLGNTIENGNVSYTRDPTEQGLYVEGTTVTVSCDEGYKGGGTITCQNNGTWSSSSLPIYDCTMATCPDLGHSIENGNVSYTRDPTEQGRYVENTTVTVSCDEGYRGGGVITCQNDGNWSSSHLPKCTNPKMLIIVILLIAVGLLCFFAIMCTVFPLYRYYHSYRNDMIQKYFGLQARRETLDPSFTPVDVRPRKKISITMSIKTFDDYDPFYDQDSLCSGIEDELCSTKVPNKTDIPAIVKENSDSCLNVSMDEEEKDEEKTSTTTTPDIDISFHFINSSANPNCVHYANVDVTKSVTDACDEVTTESVTVESELSPNEDLCWTPSPLYVNDFPGPTLAQSTSGHDDSISSTISSPPHNPAAEVSLAFEMVDATSAPPQLQNQCSDYVHESGSGYMFNSSSGYVCDSSSAYVYESELKCNATMAMPSYLNPEGDRHTDACGPVKHLSLECLRLPPSDRCEDLDHSYQTASYSSGYLSEEHAKSRYMASTSETILGQHPFSMNHSPLMTHKVKDLGDGYVDVMAYSDSD